MECWFMGCWIIWFLPSEWIPQWKGRRKNRNEIAIPLFWDLSSALFHRRAAGWAAWLGVMASVEFLSFLLRVLIGECSAMLRFSSVAKDWEVWPAPLHPVKTQGILCTAAAALLLETLTCCNFLVQKTENHQNTETISSTIILLTYLIKILAYWMLHCCNNCCVEWWYAKLPKKIFFCGIVLLCSERIKKYVYLFLSVQTVAVLSGYRNQWKVLGYFFIKRCPNVSLTGKERGNAS